MTHTHTHKKKISLILITHTRARANVGVLRFLNAPLEEPTLVPQRIGCWQCVQWLQAPANRPVSGAAVAGGAAVQKTTMTTANPQRGVLAQDCLLNNGATDTERERGSVCVCMSMGSANCKRNDAVAFFEPKSLG